jgi:hypothetical protein
VIAGGLAALAQRGAGPVRGIPGGIICLGQGCLAFAGIGQDPDGGVVR